MRKILTLLILINLIVSCSEEDSTNEQQIAEFPKNITLSSQTAEIGNVLTINGNGFLLNGTYKITFAENEIAEIIEINSNYLNVEVPENSISGSITLTFNNQTETIGTIEISTQASTTDDLFLFKRNYENNNDQVSLIKYDLDSSIETIVYDLGNDFDQNTSLSSYDGINAVYNPIKNEIITLNTGDYSLLTVNLTDGTETKHMLNAGNYENYNGLIISNKQEILLFKRNYENNNDQVSLIKYDLDSSIETIVYDLGNDFDQNTSLSSYDGINAVYNPIKNEIITLNTADYSLLTVNLTDGTETKRMLNAGNYENYSGLIIK